ncbi:MAG: sulfatase-like hydrolase/transferase [Planctomycetaceae bacterium]|jgi:hypothetical protein|nr:sulfatase-like hydrolase/transferase [Planctomycetaceae bacterium]
MKNLLFVTMMLLFVFNGLLGNVSAQENSVPKATRPNILLIIADDLTYRDLGCYGSVNVKTHHIDSLASEGMKFLHCYNAIAMCVPTRNMLYSNCLF